ncbi:hypothetical protein BDF19DRAFT_413573 [Syncephalis fuscata]|nr:hypothetical protein BDF19DRAFT_413573 [Syncephalis fuscata]
MADTSNRRSASPVALSRPITPPTSATIRVSPSEFTFQTSKTHPQVLVGRVSLRIVAADAPIGFKFKTNAPDRYSVRPVLGVLSPLGESVEIFARCEGAIQPDDRFMIESITLTEEEAQQFDSKKQWKSFDRRRIVENFIHCRMPSQPSSSNSSTTSFHTVSLAPNTNASWSTSASPRVRGHLSHSRAPSLELPMSRRSNHNNTNHATSNAAAAVQRSASPSRRSLVVGNRVSHHSYAGSDVEADLDNDEKRERTNRYSMNSVVIRKQQQHIIQCRVIQLTRV